MAATASTMLPLGTSAPGFQLPDSTGRLVSKDDFAGSPTLLVMFLCNHCPYVKHVAEEVVRVAREYQARGVAVVAISRYDQSQDVAKAYHAACTPDFFLFDADRKLVYRGQLDGARPGNDVPVSGHDLRTALDAVLARKPVPEPQLPSLGCSIKWKPGNEPDFVALRHAAAGS